MTTGIGPVTTVGHVRDAVRATLETWLPSTLAGVLRAHGEPTDLLRAPAAWRGLSSWQELQEDQWPAAAVTCNGSQALRRHGDGTYTLTWRVLAALFARASSYDEVGEHIGIYAHAMMAALLQHPSLGGVASSTTLVGVQLDPLPAHVARSVGGALVTVDVTVDRSLDDTAGPLTPPDDPHAEPVEGPTVEEGKTAVVVDHDEEL